jgi:hypothetical protein
MIFLNQEINKIIANYYNWDERQLNALSYLYNKYVTDTIIGETVIYLEQNNLPELQELNKLIEANNKNHHRLNSQLKITDFIFKLTKKFPEVEQNIIKEVQKLNQDLISAMAANIDQETGQKIVAEMDKDLSKMDRYVKKLKDWGYPVK